MRIHSQEEQSAELVVRENLEATRTLFGDGNSETLKNLDLLATPVHNQGRTKEALPLWKELVQQRMRLSGWDHWLGLVASMNQASDDTILSLQDAVVDFQFYVLNYVQLLIAGLEENFRPGHVSFMMTVFHLIHRSNAEAEKLNIVSLEMLQKDYGERHLATIQSMQLRALILQCQTCLAEAENLQVQVDKYLRENLDAGQPKGLQELQCPAVIRKFQGRPQEGEELELE
ncbi:Fc.00g051180.m01.CDS01 [Cosmosporella sp. VM-42]